MVDAKGYKELAQLGHINEADISLFYDLIKVIKNQQGRRRGPLPIVYG